MKQPATHTTFTLGDEVRKTKGSQWHGHIVGFYSTSLTPEGYAVESSTEKGSVQIYPAAALELVKANPAARTKVPSVQEVMCKVERYKNAQAERKYASLPALRKQVEDALHTLAHNNDAKWLTSLSQRLIGTQALGKVQGKEVIWKESALDLVKCHIAAATDVDAAHSCEHEWIDSPAQDGNPVTGACCAHCKAQVPF